MAFLLMTQIAAAPNHSMLYLPLDRETSDILFVTAPVVMPQISSKSQLNLALLMHHLHSMVGEIF